MQSILDLGTDVDSRYVMVACAAGSFKPHRIVNEAKAIRAWLRTVPRGSRLALESTGSYHELLADLAHQVSEVSVTGWDAAQGSRITSQSSGASTGPGQGRSGVELLSSALGERSHHIGHLVVNTDAEGRAVADAAFDERRRRFVTVRGVAEGNPALRVGTHVELKGLGARFSNTYYVVRACHRFDLERGYETEFTGECAFLGRPS